MNQTTPTRRRRRAKPLRRVYLRMSEQEYAGLQRLGVLSERCVGDVILDAVRDHLTTMAHKDYSFEQWWRDECFRIAREEHSL